MRSLRRELAAGHAPKQPRSGNWNSRRRSIQHLVVPGLLQTRPSALALFQRAHPAGRDAKQAADARLARQRLLDDQAHRFEWMITEAALWWRPAPTFYHSFTLLSATPTTSPGRLRCSPACSVPRWIRPPAEPYWKGSARFAAR